MNFDPVNADWFPVAIAIVNLIKPSVVTRIKALWYDALSTVITSIDTVSNGLVADKIPNLTGLSLNKLLLLHTLFNVIPDNFIITFPVHFAFSPRITLSIHW